MLAVSRKKMVAYRHRYLATVTNSVAFCMVVFPAKGRGFLKTTAAFIV